MLGFFLGEMNGSSTSHMWKKGSLRLMEVSFDKDEEVSLSTVVPVLKELGSEM